ncbi:metallophosphoesterase family protein [Candidatus Micrarchaeota archaeon]|nr:metallophosphoesterase family protein [Candidatus Micrarchaeota archaeon]
MKLLYNAPAIFHKGAIIVGDTHFGMEGKLRKKGIYDEQFSMRLFLRLKELVVRHKAKKVIFVGDVKEEIPILDRKTEQVLNELAKICEIIIVRGNHDGGIERILEHNKIEHSNRIVITPSEGIVYEELGLVHGHSWPSEEVMNCNYIITGHQHPMITLTDSSGRKHSEPVWVIAEANVKNIKKQYKSNKKKTKLILMPSFNPLLGSNINSDENYHLGPILNKKLYKLADALVFRLDGTNLGKLRNIK